jgi:hypothetical protein
MPADGFLHQRTNPPELVTVHQHINDYMKFKCQRNNGSQTENDQRHNCSSLNIQMHSEQKTTAEIQKRFYVC